MSSAKTQPCAASTDATVKPRRSCREIDHRRAHDAKRNAAVQHACCRDVRRRCVELAPPQNRAGRGGQGSAVSPGPAARASGGIHCVDESIAGSGVNHVEGPAREIPAGDGDPIDVERRRIHVGSVSLPQNRHGIEFGRIPHRAEIAARHLTWRQIPLARNPPGALAVAMKCQNVVLAAGNQY